MSGHGSSRYAIDKWAASVVEATLGGKVEIHDDNSAPSMYDLRIGPVQAT